VTSLVPDDSVPRYIVLGVTPRQPLTVVSHAVRFAQRFDAVLVCANVDPGSYVVTEHPNGSIEYLPVDPDAPEELSGPFDGELANRIRTVAGHGGVQVEFRRLAGEIAHALGRLADVLQAEMIVVGSRHRGVWSGLQEFLGGSVAAHLAHRQHRPVVVIPVAPVSAGDRLPWDETDF
jgi:nucleotide-binding universal stress UspA family protein